MKSNSQIIRDMPKIELHLHLEGAFTLEYLLEQIHKYEPASPIRNVKELRKRFEFNDFEHFLKAWNWKNRYFRTQEDFRKSVFMAIEALVKQNVIALEAFFSPWDFLEAGISSEEVIRATIAGAEDAQKCFGIPINLIADIIRNHGHDTAINRLDELMPYKEKICGIGLGGDETHFPAAPFKDVFLEARKRGFRVTAHAGESAGPDSVRDAVCLLGVERIGHGIASIHDPSLIKMLKEKQIPLEICPTSNLKTRVVDKVENHPVRSFFNTGLLVTLNTDDPTMFGISITEEFEFLNKSYSFSLREIKQLTKNALHASFFNEGQKILLNRKIEAFWEKILTKEN